MTRKARASDNLAKQAKAALRELKAERRELDAEIASMERIVAALSGPAPARHASTRSRATEAKPSTAAEAKPILLAAIQEQGSMTQAEAYYRFGTTAARALLKLAEDPKSGVSPNGHARWKRGQSPNFVWRQRETVVRPGERLKTGRRVTA